MICRAVIGRVNDSAPGVDWVHLTWQQTLRRALRLTSRGGRRIDVLLPPGGRLAHGDVLINGDATVAVWVESIHVLAIDPGDAVTRGRLAFHLGNLHVPVQITPTSVLTPDDGPAHAAADLFGLSVTPRVERFYPEPVTLNDVRSQGDKMPDSTRIRFRPRLVAVAALMCAAVATAHPGHAEHGLASGVLHPLTGLDHVLAMLGVGVLAAMSRRAWRWALPLTFVGMMVLGAAAGLGGWFVPSWLAETLIALSVAVFGLLVMLGARVPAFVVAPLVALFAVCHGSAHAAEMPNHGSAGTYFAGFVLSTALLHAAGIGLGIGIGRGGYDKAFRGLGAAMSLCGGMMLAGLV